MISQTCIFAGFYPCMYRLCIITFCLTDKPKTKTAIKKIKQSVVLKADQTSIEFKVVSQETAEKSKAR